MRWRLSDRFDPASAQLADRHYSRRKVGSPQFVQPGRCLVLHASGENGNAYWVSVWPFAQYVRHAWAGAWQCSAFRNEGAGLSSDLIRQALAATRAHWGEPPPLGLVTFVNADKVRRKRDPGRCFLRAGGELDGKTKAGLVVIRFPPDAIPPAEPCLGMQGLLNWVDPMPVSPIPDFRTSGQMPGDENKTKPPP